MSLVGIVKWYNLRVRINTQTGGRNRLRRSHHDEDYSTTSTPWLFAHEEGSDPIEDLLRTNIRAMIVAVFNEELESVLGRYHYERTAAGPKGYRNGHREREIIGTFGPQQGAECHVRVSYKKMGGLHSGVPRHCPVINV